MTPSPTSTKYILHGGFHPGQTDEDNRDFFREILREAPEHAKVLLVPFAKNVDRVLPATTKISGEFEKNKWQQKIVIEVATEENFIQQVISADVIYFQGGVSLKLLDVLKKYPDLKKSVQGKIVAGESAGANVLGAFFYSPHANEVYEGLGFVPVKVIPHYTKEYEGRLDAVGQGIELLALPEYSYKIFSI